MKSNDMPIVRKNRVSRSVILMIVLMSCAMIVYAGGQFKASPHGSAISGVWRVAEYPKGSCAQCHINHSAASGNVFGLFQQNSNRLCFSQSMGGCHADKPTGGTSGYPAQESDRLPSGSSDPGYFEVNAGGNRLPGVANRVRWPGQLIWEDPLYNPHSADPDMPAKDVMGFGSCDNCHAVHGSSSPHDMTDTTFRGLVGSQSGSLPANYRQCFVCHSAAGPAGMNQSSKLIADFYNTAFGGERRGHEVGGGGYVPSNARLSCSDCHNPHGSAGYSNLGPNGFLISDQRPGWYALTNIKNDNTQVRRFCFGCHTSSDGIGGGTVQGMNPERLPSEVSHHAFNGTTHCYDCHGRDYSSSSGNNVHNPSDGE
jgi:Doubled CXXCH motif (Paired_CXXCH_1)